MKILLPLALLMAPLVAKGQTYYLEHGTSWQVERGQTIHRTPGGGIYVGGSKSDSAMVQRIGAHGEVLWARAFKPSTTYPCLVMHLNSTPDGYLIGCGNGMSTGSIALRDGFHFKLDTLGNVLWVRRWTDTRPVYTKRIVPRSATSYLLFGDVYDVNGSSTYADVFTAHVDAATGDVTWNSDLLDLYAAVPYIDDIASTTELGGGHYATGRLFAGGSPSSKCRVYVSRYDSVGMHQWTKYLFYPNTADRRMYGSDIIAHDDSLTIAFFGDVNGSGSDFTIGVARLDTAGNLAWGRSYDFPWSTSEYVSSICATANGYLVCGYGIGTSGRNLFLLEVSRTGAVLWGRYYGNTSQETGLAYHYAPNLVIDGNAALITARRKYTNNNENELLIRTDLLGQIACNAYSNPNFTSTVLPNASFLSTWASYPLNLTLSPALPSENTSIRDGCVNASPDLGPDSTSCAPVMLSAGVAGASYLWSTGGTTQTLLADTGTYWVQVTLDCCTRTDTIHISGGDPPVADFTWVQDPPGSTDVVFTNTSVNDDWNLWVFGSTTATGDTTTFGFQEYGHYMVGLVVGNDCGTDTLWQQVDVFPATGMAAGAGVEHLTCFGRPDGLVVVLPGPGTWMLDVFDVRGALIHSTSALAGTVLLPGLTRHGLYTVRARQAGRTATGRAVLVR